MDKKTQKQRFCEACFNGNLILAKKLLKTYDLTDEDVRSDKNQALRWACYNGHTPVAQWLAETFTLTIEDARSKDNCALRWACQNGHASTAQWFLDTFYTVEDALEINKYNEFSKEMKEWLQNYQPIGVLTKAVEM